MTYQELMRNNEGKSFEFKFTDGEKTVGKLALRQTGGQVLGRRQGRPRCRHVAFPHQYLGLRGMG